MIAIVLLAAAVADQCIVSGGNNFGVIIQNCAPIPQMIPIQPKKGEPLTVRQAPDGSFVWQQFVKIVGPTDVRAVACGGDVTEVLISPWPAGMVSGNRHLTGLPKNCLGRDAYNAESGTWLIQARTRTKTGTVTIKAMVGDLTSVP